MKKNFPEMKGFSPRNIKYMRKFAEVWREYEIVQQLVAQIPWRSNIVLLDKLSENEERIWYAQMTLKNGWSSNILEMQIQTDAHSEHHRHVNGIESIDVGVEEKQVHTSSLENQVLGQVSRTESDTLQPRELVETLLGESVVI